MHILVSICVPIYNVAPFIERCARSVFNQSYPNCEFLFVDDCSPDSSIATLTEIVSEYPHLKDRIRVICHDRNLGLAAARNSAVVAANGEFIMHVDSDDWLEHNAVELLVREQKRTDSDIVSGNAIAHYKDREELLQEPDLEDKDILMRHMAELTLNHVIWRRLIRRSLYTENGIEAASGVNIGEDHHTLPRLIYYAKKCVKLDVVVYHYNRQNDNSYTSCTNYSHMVKRMKDDLASINILLQFFADKDPICMNQLKQAKAKYTLRCLNRCYERHDVKLYNSMAKELFSTDKKSLLALGLPGIKVLLAKGLQTLGLPGVNHLLIKKQSNIGRM